MICMLKATYYSLQMYLPAFKINVWKYKNEQDYHFYLQLDYHGKLP